jgi:Flp pilus assembly pilin Flp
MTHKILRHIIEFGRQDAGNTVTEYAVMLSLIVLTSIGAVIALGQKIAVVFGLVSQVG